MNDILLRGKEDINEVKWPWNKASSGRGRRYTNVRFAEDGLLSFLSVIGAGGMCPCMGG